jgi:hypothetical protein
LYDDSEEKYTVSAVFKFESPLTVHNRFSTIASKTSMDCLWEERSAHYGRKRKERLTTRCEGGEQAITECPAGLYVVVVHTFVIYVNVHVRIDDKTFLATDRRRVLEA